MNNNRKEKVLEMLKNSKTIAVIGMKDNVAETAYRIPLYMSKHGYKIYPVNPKNEGKEILGEVFVSKVNDLKIPIDLVDVFRRPEFLTAHAKEILNMNPLPKYVWFQLGISNNEAVHMLEEKGIKVIQDECIMVEHSKYL
jgi:predicted CoA-binding protein